MKLIRHFALCALVLLALTAGCKKEEGEKQSVTFDVVIAPEAHTSTDGTKVYLNNDLYPSWNTGDNIWVNSGVGTVTKSPEDETRGTFNGSSITVYEDKVFCAVFPSHLGDTTIGTSHWTVDLHQQQKIKLPRVQKYETITVDGATRQKITAPMFAYTNATGLHHPILQFHNLCGMMKITITNDKAWDMILDSIQVESTAKRLNGEMPITGHTSVEPTVYAINHPVLGLDTFDISKREMNTVSLGGINKILRSKLLENQTGSGSEQTGEDTYIDLYVYLPVIENSSDQNTGINDNRFYVRVFSHPRWKTGTSTRTVDKEVEISYEIRQTESTYAYVERNSIIPISINLSDCRPTFTSLKPFTVSSGTQVSISRGNAQYYIKTYDATQADCNAETYRDFWGTLHEATTYEGTGYWRFAPRQWDFLYTPSLTHSDYSTGKWIEHFTWDSGNKPTHHYHSGQAGSDANTRFHTWQQDWGTKYTNVTSSTTWRTWTQSELHYLLKQRTTVNSNNLNNFCWVTITDAVSPSNTNNETSLYGIMVIPDAVNVTTSLDINTRKVINSTNNTQDICRNFKYFATGVSTSSTSGDIAPRYRNDNSFTKKEFEFFEAKGCIFIPCIGVYAETGQRNDGWDDVRPEGAYWTTTKNGTNDAVMLLLGADRPGTNYAGQCDCHTQARNINDGECYRHFCVRLVRPYVQGGNTYKYDPLQ